MASPSEPPRLGYVLKVYPRFSETFVVAELWGREEAGADVEVFSLRPPVDGRFHDTLAAVRAPVTYLRHDGLRVADLWDTLRQAVAELPRLPATLPLLAQAEGDQAAQALELALLVRRRGITHLHAHFASVATTVARLAARLAGVPYSFTAHAKDLFHQDVSLDDLATKVRDAHHVVTVCDFNLRWLRDRLGSDARRVHRVYNGLDLAAFPYTTPLGRPRQVVAVGRFVEKKGFGDLVDAVALLARRGVDVRCTIAGTGPLWPEVQAQVVRQGLTDRVALPGALTRPEVARLVGSAAVLAAPCVVGADGNQDALPTVLLEAMALGTPCVSTDVGGIPEVVRPGVTGLVVPPHDPGRLADALGALLDDPALGCRLAGAARELVVAQFDVRRQGRALQELLVGAGTASAAAGIRAGVPLEVA